MLPGKGTRSDSKPEDINKLAKSEHTSADLQAPPRVRTNGGVGNTYYAMLEDDENEPENTPKSQKLGIQVSKKVSEAASTLGSMKSIFRLKSYPEGSMDVPLDEALLDDDDECLHNDDVAMRVDSYVDYRALAASHQRRQRRLFRKSSHS